ncbi:MAG: serine acetyltransferase [Planctomycetota bacterium]
MRLKPTPEWLWERSRRAYQKGHRRRAALYKALNFKLHHCLLPAEASVGERPKLRHYGIGTVIHPNCDIGDDVIIYHQVTIAGESWLGSPHRVRIGDRVMLGTGCKIIPRKDTGLTIGDDAVIGAGAVVTRDVPAKHVATGVPARTRPREVE